MGLSKSDQRQYDGASFLTWSTERSWKRGQVGVLSDHGLLNLKLHWAEWQRKTFNTVSFRTQRQQQYGTPAAKAVQLMLKRSILLSEHMQDHDELLPTNMDGGQIAEVPESTHIHDPMVMHGHG